MGGLARRVGDREGQGVKNIEANGERGDGRGKECGCKRLLPYLQGNSQTILFLLYLFFNNISYTIDLN